MVGRDRRSGAGRRVSTRVAALACGLAVLLVADGGAVRSAGARPGARQALASPPPVPAVAATPEPSEPMGQAGQRAASRLRAAPDGRPPQFVVISFDGAGTPDLWEHWRRVGAAGDARFTFFLSGVYLLAPAGAGAYQPPRHPRGSSAIGFNPLAERGGTPAAVSRLIEQLAAGHLEGHEIASHLNGHFCAPDPGRTGAWNRADWNQELDQFAALVDGVTANNHLPASAGLPFTSAWVSGVRTPCLEGDPRLFYPVLAAHGYRYDASQNAIQGTWPSRQDGIWSMPLHSIPLVGTRLSVLSMDYNFYANQSAASEATPARWNRIEAQTLASLDAYFDAAYRGGRAPISIGWHFEHWNGDAYNRALEAFIVAHCRLREVACVTYRTLTGWLDSLSPEELARYRAGEFPQAGLQ